MATKRVKPEGQNIVDWLNELVASDREAQKAYKDEMMRLRPEETSIIFDELDELDEENDCYD